MANNLKKFTTEAEYTAATLNYPAVSWVTSGDTVHFDKTAPVVVNDKVMLCWTTPNNVPADTVVIYNCGTSAPPTDYFDSITFNDVEIISQAPSAYDCSLDNATIPNSAVTYTIKYHLNSANETQIGDEFAGELGGGFGSDPKLVDFLVPAQVTEIQSIPNNVGNLVIEAATPPTTSIDWSSITPVIYVPDNAVSVYQTAWSVMLEHIKPISEYQGNLPV
jgi:hypothetical protein